MLTAVYTVNTMPFVTSLNVKVTNRIDYCFLLSMAIIN